MVHIKVISQKGILFILLLVIFVGCKSQNREIASNLENLFSNDSLSSKYCFPEIKDSLSKQNIPDAIERQTKYYQIDKNKVLKLTGLKDGQLKSINEFYEYTVLTESYIMKNQNDDFLIMIGQSAGATGIGVDYWNYQCYRLNKNGPMLEFSSLIKTPYSIYTNINGQINHIEVENDYPRPASGEEIKLNYVPLLVHIFNGKNRKSTMVFHCKQ